VVVERLGFQYAGSCDVVAAVEAFRLVVAFDAFLEDPALASGSLGNRDPASGNTEVQRQPHSPSSQPASLTYFVAFVAHRSLCCMAWPDAGPLDVADHMGCLAT